MNTINMDTINMNTLTIVALGYWSIAALWAGFRGMIRTVLSFLVIILTVVITYAATPVVYQSLHGSANISNYMQEHSSVVVDNLADSIAVGTDSPGWLEILPLPEEARAVIETGDNELIAQVIRSDSVRQYLSVQLSNLIIRIVATVFTAVILFIILTIIRFILLRMADLPGVSALDHFLGFLIGLIKGLIVIWILMFIIRLVALTGNGMALMNQIQESEVLSLLDQYNLVRAVIMSLIASL